jgi:hypothetical protein
MPRPLARDTSRSCPLQAIVLLILSSSAMLNCGELWRKAGLLWSFRRALQKGATKNKL